MKSGKTPGYLLKEIEEALLDAFPGEAELTRMLRYQFDIHLPEIAGGNNYRDIVYQVLIDFESRDCLLELVNKAWNENQDNRKLQLLAEKINAQFKIKNNPITKYFDNELAQILNVILDFQICKNVCENILPDFKLHSPNYSINDVSHLRKLFLYHYPDRLSDGSLPIVRFADCLAHDDRLEEPIRQKLRAWVNKVTKELNLPYPCDDKPKIPKILTSYLLIIIKPQDKQYYLNAYLIPNDEDKDNIEPVDIELNHKGILCSYNELENKIASLIEKSLSRLNDLTDRHCELTIEFFLTIDSLHEKVEQWKISDDLGGFHNIGERYRVIVRSYERLEKPALTNSLRGGIDRLKRYRIELNNKDIQDRIEHCHELDSFDWKKLQNQLEEKIGLKLTCPLPVTEKERRELFKAILISGIPIAIWTRNSNLPNVCLKNDIENFFNLDFLKDFSMLFENLLSERKKAYAEREECEKYLGYHLGVLCEEPHLEEFPNLKGAIKNLVGGKNG